MSQEYPINAGVPQGSILCPTPFLLYFDLLDDDCNIANYADDTTLYCNCEHIFDLNLNLTQEIALDSGRQWLVDFVAGKAQLLFDWSTNSEVVLLK